MGIFAELDHSDWVRLSLSLILLIFIITVFWLVQSADDFSDRTSDWTQKPHETPWENGPDRSDDDEFVLKD